MICDIQESVKSYRGCALAAKSPPVKFQLWPKTDSPWTRLHIDSTGPVNGVYYLIMVDSYTKWLEICRCRKPTSMVTIELLHELFAGYGVLDTIVSNNGMQLEFKKFCKCTQLNTSLLHHIIQDQMGKQDGSWIHLKEH
ncbi:uncharacterized protein K02A2.6-like [Octopus bimaculoides]|uniref:uncharacterized protein K02A2.6-like n=1 Tax=Octopus bimaculoides TaxID=37653 RepID=UPI00071C9212|nr:uncharacterized protein K02A2.6-like [Octopus bimaculoides]|eukprot:XP_014785649.1 PREDICTED: uncharacterized protein K02A2.6-like [Octopus bimaculoides]